MMDTLPDGWALIDPVDIEADSPLAQVCAAPGNQRVGVALQGADGWNDTVVLTRTDVPDDMSDLQWLTTAVAHHCSGREHPHVPGGVHRRCYPLVHEHRDSPRVDARLNCRRAKHHNFPVVLDDR